MSNGCRKENEALETLKLFEIDLFAGVVIEKSRPEHDAI